jgi:hypothetical protein
MPAEAILAIIIGVGYLVAVVFWVTNYFSRVEPFLLREIGDRLGLKIKRVWRNWKIQGQHTWRQGCLVMLLELVATFFILIAPFWLLIAVILGMALSFSGNN